MNEREYRRGNYYIPTDNNDKQFLPVTANDLKAWEMGAVYGKNIFLTEEWFKSYGFKYEKFNLTGCDKYLPGCMYIHF